MSTRYATQTGVSVEKSKAELERTLSRYGATQFMTAWDASGQAVVAFLMSRRMVQFRMNLPPVSDFEKTPGGRRRRKASDQQRAHEQACRSYWRAFNLVVKAKLEAVEAGISTFEEEFLAHIMLPDGSTVGPWMAPQLEVAYTKHKMPRLLPGGAA